MGSHGWWEAWDHASIFVFRPLLAISFVFSLILLSWFVAWKTVLVHAPLVQEIFGLRKKPVKPKPPTRHRLSRFYNSTRVHSKKKLDGEENSQESR
ncbi:hypothetical protein J5N97_012408 [Dioscorea zingiberensis]|uniref:Transmembrane protein n=1 Tax=Dioscorea zingiberensis TaxID=325984 RepID=A0A9D5CPP1_9LILI|nr:hypothetical protein J5N97_012408 [Dioscorea zingiberensis]